MTHRGRPAFALMVVVLWAALFAAAPTGATGLVVASEQAVSEQVTAAEVGAPVQAAPAQADDPDRCRTIIGCAAAGPAPENPGDRGGYAQLLTLAVLAGAIGFIMTKVLRAARSSQPGPPG